MNFIENETTQKLRGGYYTPLDLAVFLVRWIKGIKPRIILEPSCGDGVFFEAMARTKLKTVSVSGFEIDEGAAAKARAKCRQHFPDARIHAEDFLLWAMKSLRNRSLEFDAIVGNPPFIRYQYLPANFQQIAEEIFRHLGLPFTKHTNAWVPFVLACVALLRPGGRLAMVVPSEIIHIMHAQSLRTYLGQECRRIVIVDPKELWFDEALQGTVLLLAEKRLSERDKPQGVGIYPVKGKEFVAADPEEIFASPKSLNGRTVQGKWTYALLDPSTRSLLDRLSRHPHVHRFKDIAKVDVGIVTGANDFFLVPDNVVDEFGLSQWAYPMFGRSEHCPGVIYDKVQHEQNRANGKPTNFILFRDESALRSASVRKYVALGEEQNLHTRYKCRVRTPWYSVPSVYSTEIGLLKRSHDAPRLILNKMNAFTTDTAYRIQLLGGISNQQLVGSFVNSLTALTAELEGRHYGGGVLEMVPSEIEKLLIPIIPSSGINLTALDHAVRTYPMKKVLESQDEIILKALKVKQSDREELFESWARLRGRRQRISSEKED